MILNINKLDKQMEKFTGDGLPWEYLKITALQYLQYLLHAKERVPAMKDELRKAIRQESESTEELIKNERFFDEIFRVTSK